VKLPRGSILRVKLDPTSGHEQAGVRPCVVVSREDLADQQRFADQVIVVVPLTGALGLGRLYPVIQPYPRGLTKPSSALVDMIRGVDKVRVTGTLAPLPDDDLRRLDDALRSLLGLP
jgi:mRNA interferase MazF